MHLFSELTAKIAGLIEIKGYKKKIIFLRKKIKYLYL